MSSVDVPETTTLRIARPQDARSLAALHAMRIDEGFLPTLGRVFLTRLYRRITVSSHACAFVVEEGGEIVAFAAGATDVGLLYREFLVRDGVVAAIAAAPRIARSWRRVIETLRYPGATAELPRAEVLSVATSGRALGRGLGSSTVRAVVGELAGRGAPAVKVTVGAANVRALAMYRACGFEMSSKVGVHAGTSSEVLVCTVS
jgi:ribosomal protein S18 acetylase RimI-like enzyme